MEVNELTNEEYINKVAAVLRQEDVEYQMQLQILETVSELLEYYSIDFVKELLPSLFQYQVT